MSGTHFKILDEGYEYLVNVVDHFR